MLWRFAVRLVEVTGLERSSHAVYIGSTEKLEFMVSQSENSDMGLMSEFHTTLHKIIDLRRSCRLASWQGTVTE